jgi:hypothetical protein
VTLFLSTTVDKSSQSPTVLHDPKLGLQLMTGQSFKNEF